MWRVRALALCFGFGSLASGLAALTLLVPQSPLERIWRLNPEGHRGLQSLGGWGILLMLAVCAACLSAALGLWLRAGWARWLAALILAINLVGDGVTAIVRHDARTLIGIPIGGALLLLLVKDRWIASGARPSQ